MNVDTPSLRIRERKRRETHRRISETGLRLFLENGYDATTLDAIAAAAGISRRTFFYYFQSKEDVLLAYEGGGFGEALGPALREQPADQSPIAAARACFLLLADRYETGDSILADRLLRSTESLRSKKELSFLRLEQTLLEAMTERWPEADLATLRLDSMIAIGALRLSIEQWRAVEGKTPLAACINRSFTLMDDQFQKRSSPD